jgi:hypothetical protein
MTTLPRRNTPLQLLGDPSPARAKSVSRMSYTEHRPWIAPGRTIPMQVDEQEIEAVAQRSSTRWPLLVRQPRPVSMTQKPGN